MSRLAIIDSGGANIASLQFAIERLGVASDADDRPGSAGDSVARHPSGRGRGSGLHGTP